jgi:anti-anti-sigma regulatory factor
MGPLDGLLGGLVAQFGGSAMSTTTPLHAPGVPWLTTAQIDEDALLVTVNGGIAADRAETLWAAVEEALEQAHGRLVVADLTQVTGFDHHSIDALARVTHAAVRRHLDLYVLLRSPSALQHYAHCHRLPRLWPISAFRHPGDRKGP